MSVLLETSLGDVVIDLFTGLAPKSCENFLKLAKLRYFNFAPVHTVQPNFTLQSGDPLGPESPESSGGCCVWGLLPGASKTTFAPEFHPKLQPRERGMICMATTLESDTRVAASQFIITLGDDLSELNEVAACFGKVVEGFDTMEKINSSFLDDKGRPLRDIRILYESDSIHCAA